jgi:hypothetical protein
LVYSSRSANWVNCAIVVKPAPFGEHELDTISSDHSPG